ncbi:MAG: diaminopimelate epimerase [Methanobacterium sp.]|uniref:diaminopimelate epimerase n=1 Tax=Methanobacterium sp. TaxID=2164 RepID=UPI003D658533|nr:diaminopimelate epimerase [Methanobacterium sp.]
MNIQEIKFSKMHGLGNDYIVIDETSKELISEEMKPKISAELCRRGFSIGSDGVIFVCPATSHDIDIKFRIFNSNGSEVSTLNKCDIRFRIFNSDGSEAEMCGNGIRCFSKYVYDKGIIKKEKIIVETLGGIKVVDLTIKNGEVASSKVDMGLATFKASEIPIISENDEFLDDELMVNGKPYRMTTVNVGNPHAVIFTDNLKGVPLNEVGPAIETHEAFPQKTNVHFVKILNKNEIDMITWERGAGFTFACGTGATSSVLAGFKLSKLDKNVLVHLPGGDLNIEIYEEKGILGAFMEGDAVLVFDGTIKIEL